MDIVYSLEKASATRFPSGEDPCFKLTDWQFSRAFESGSISDLSSEWIQVESILKLSRALVASASQLLDLYDHHLRPTSLKLSKGLASLPDEILMYILRFAQGEELSGMDALRFSHVSRRFQRLIVGNRVFWSSINLCRRSKKECIDMQLARGGNDACIHVTLEYDQHDWDLVEFLDTFSTTAPRWGSLIVKGKFYEEDRGESIFDKLFELFEDRHLILPQLHEMHVEELQIHGRKDIADDEDSDIADEELYEYCWFTCETDFEDVRAWDLPNLRTIKCIECIPPPSFPFNSFTSLSISIHVLPSSDDVANQVNELKDFIASKPSITELSLALGGYAASGQVEHDFEIKPVVYPNVTSFKLNISQFEKYKVIDSLTQALKMPQLRDFKLIDTGYTGMDRRRQRPLVVVPSPLNHPLLESYALNITDRMYDDPQTFMLHLDKLPNVSTLSVTTSGGAFFWCDPKCPLEHKSLRKLRFESCERLDSNCLDRAVSTLKKVGAWKTLESLEIQDCEELDREMALEIVGEKRLRFVDT
ncbi:hypothetical protein SCHPADRAFT_944428 [Schizopora paradoxa]|uniref:F-box domain-containing protein n=1 Tax=Schizopora paradoxa TaxID=27342 RepID=A0A0H2RG26_9AGAM|nr:hypothetical protein SCHPADRAFT_944428 [Schizopora paradoxa]